MLAKKTVKNQITLPKKIADQFPGVEYFEVLQRNDLIILKPLRPSRAMEVRERLADLGIGDADIADAVAWARRQKS